MQSQKCIEKQSLVQRVLLQHRTVDVHGWTASVLCCSTEWPATQGCWNAAFGPFANFIFCVKDKSFLLSKQQNVVVSPLCSAWGHMLNTTRVFSSEERITTLLPQLEYGPQSTRGPLKWTSKNSSRGTCPFLQQLLELEDWVSWIFHMKALT